MYEITIRYRSGYADIGTVDTFPEVRGVLDRARELPGYVSYSVREVA